MNHFSHIQKLLEKYWEGETSLEEERTLKTYFSSGKVDEQLSKYIPLFSAIREEQAVQMPGKASAVRPQMYDLRIWAAAASVALLLFAGWWMFSKPVVEPMMANQPPVPLNTPATPQEEVIAKPESVDQEEIAVALPAKSAKAIRKAPKSRPAPAALDPEEEKAIEEIKAALALVSSKLGKGRKEAAKGAGYLESVDRIFKKKDG